MGKPYRYVQLIKPYCVVQVTKGIQYYMQWNLSTMDTLGTKTFVLIGEMSFNSLYLYQPGSQSGVLINQGISIQLECLLIRVPLYKQHESPYQY